MSSPSLRKRVSGLAGTLSNRGQGLEKVVLRIEPTLDLGQGPGAIGRGRDVGNDCCDGFAFARDDEFFRGVGNLAQQRRKKRLI
jgi:hypothetical protein